MTNEEASKDLLGVIKEQIDSLSDPNSKINLIMYYIYKLHDMKDEIKNIIYEDWKLCPFCRRYYKREEEVVEKDIINGGMLEEDTKYDEIIKYCPKCGREISRDRIIRKENFNDSDSIC